ncbi:oxidoreductase [Thermogemmatispora aurantia]|jgi:xylose dehydrogenase (NAD/NADP)|uniref:Oxidoreductase n=1 Tax=Thermogemmatispora aurantia TaxID=2045279 RepID=A0A5J4K4Z4_9CHLR|nr:Gfo/Idh/MocA family oxidoreductase [Thermogemmatispora aurantia]GER81821.1 oxidoreductase [Thermogemmatispora aurantia]
MRSELHSAEAPVKWGILGAASVALKRVIPAIQAAHNAQLVAIASREPDRVRLQLSAPPAVRIYSDYESLLADEGVEAVYVPLPNSMHAEWSMRALKAGKHVLCEKPLALTVEQGLSMLQTARAQGRLLMEAFMYRFHPQMLWVMEQISEGLIGAVKLVRSSFYFDLRSRPQDIRLQTTLGGGSLVDVGCYSLNLCRAIYGRAPLAVGARVYAPARGEVERAVVAFLDFGEGRFALIDSSFELPTRQLAEIIGENGTLLLNGPFTPGQVETTVTLTIGDQIIVRRFPPSDPYRLEIEHFGSCLRTGRPPLLQLEESLENLATVEAIYRSAGYQWPPD